FIYSGYWESQIEEMKEKYIPMSETHVITNQTKIIGFISMVEGYLAALFIDVAYQNNGAGKESLNFEKRRRNKIRLDRKSTRLNSSHVSISYAVFCLNQKV